MVLCYNQHMRIFYDDINNHLSLEFLDHLPYSYPVALTMLDETLMTLETLEVLTCNYDENDDIDDPENVLVPHKILVSEFYSRIHYNMRYMSDEHYKWVIGALYHANPEVFMDDFNSVYQQVFNRIEWDILKVVTPSAYMKIYNWVYRHHKSKFHLPNKDSFIFNPETFAEWDSLYGDIIQFNELGFFYLYNDVNYYLPTDYNETICNCIREGQQRSDFIAPAKKLQIEKIISTFGIPYKRMGIPPSLRFVISNSVDMKQDFRHEESLII